MDKDVYYPLHKTTYEAIAYNAVGRASEIGTYPAYALVHSTGNSGWSVGIVQWDFGQPGRGQKVDLLLSNYQAWAQQEQTFSQGEVDSLAARLQRRGQVGNGLTQVEQARLNSYLRSNAGREFVNGLNKEQIEYKWTKVGEPLSQVKWLQDLGMTDPQAVAEIVAMTSKLFNQNETRGGRLVQQLRSNETTSDEVERWIESTGIEGLNPQARRAIVSGRDSALAGIRLMNALELGTGALSTRWQEVVHANGDVALANGFNFNPDVQLFDAMMRNPRHGMRVFEHIELGLASRPGVTDGINSLARLEMARVELDAAGSLVVTGPRGVQYGLTQSGWALVGDPPARRRESDMQDHFEVLRGQPLSSVGSVFRMQDAMGGRSDADAKLITWEGDPRDPATRWSVTSVQGAGAVDVGGILRPCDRDAGTHERSQAHATIQQDGPQPGRPGLH